MESQTRRLTGINCLPAGGIALICTGLFALLISIAFSTFLTVEEDKIIIVSIVAHFMLLATGIAVVIVSVRPGWLQIRIVIAAAVLSLLALLDSLVVMLLTYNYMNLLSYAVPVFVVCIVGFLFLVVVLYASIKKCKSLARSTVDHPALATPQLQRV